MSTRLPKETQLFDINVPITNRFPPGSDEFLTPVISDFSDLFLSDKVGLNTSLAPPVLRFGLGRPINPAISVTRFVCVWL